MKTRILFVDDEAHVLDGLRRMLHPLRDEWSMSFVGSASEALTLFETECQDVVVADMRMPVMDGAQLLAEVRRRYPRTVRIMLSGYSDQELVLRSIGSIHQYLAKPCEFTVLRSTIQRAIALSRLLSDERIKGIVAQMECLPSLPAVFHELVEELRQPASSLQKIGEIVSRDVGLTTQILHLVNSAYFGLRREITNAQTAVAYLGVSTISSLVMASHLFRQVDDGTLSWLDLDRLWNHGMSTAAGAKAICQAEGGDRKLVDDAFSAGLIHDAGRLVLALNFPRQYREVLDQARLGTGHLWEHERETFGVTHAEVGAYLIGIWGLPNSLTEALAYHHDPLNCVSREFGPLAAVHASCALNHEQTGRHDRSVDPQYFRELGMEDRIERWRQVVQEAPRPREEKHDAQSPVCR